MTYKNILPSLKEKRTARVQLLLACVGISSWFFGFNGLAFFLGVLLTVVLFRKRLHVKNSFLFPLSLIGGQILIIITVLLINIFNKQYSWYWSLYPHKTIIFLSLGFLILSYVLLATKRVNIAVVTLISVHQLILAFGLISYLLPLHQILLFKHLFWMAMQLSVCALVWIFVVRDFLKK